LRHWLGHPDGNLYDIVFFFRRWCTSGRIVLKDLGSLAVRAHEYSMDGLWIIMQQK